jgi:allantoate deiminase
MTILTHAQQAIARCRTLAQCTEVEGETTRTFLSPPMHQVHDHIQSWMSAAGMTVTIDPIGNIHGLHGSPTIPRLLIASHLDTVPNAGAFDGILGVMLAISLVEILNKSATTLPYAIEIIGFSEEEGVRFRKPFLGSLALTGQLDQSILDLREPEDPANPEASLTVAQAISTFGLDPTRIPEARLSPQAFAYLELHIEQGPVLESLSIPLGVVTALVGQTRLEFTFHGQGNHAGTTPMHLRRDALTAAAEWIVAVESLARAAEGLVATVGRIEAHPGAGNVIPATVTVLLDVRHAEDSGKSAAVQTLTTAAQSIASARGVQVTHRTLLDQPAVTLDPHLTDLLEQAAAATGTPAVPLTSGAGHDAMVLAPHLPTAMLFLRTPQAGLSHHPDEQVLGEDAAAALTTTLHFLRALTP